MMLANRCHALPVLSDMSQTPCNHNSKYNNNNINNTNSNNAGIKSRRKPERGTRTNWWYLTIDVTTASSVAMVNELSAVREHGVPQPTPEQMPFYDLWHRFHLPHQVHCTALCLLSHGDCMN